MRPVSLLLFVAIVSSGSCVFSRYSPLDFRGAGPMVDTGVWSYPRYLAPLGAMPLAEPGSYVFRFGTLPSESMSLDLYVEPFEPRDRARFQTLTTRLDVRIVESDGTVVCEAGGTPSGGRSGGWVLMSSSTDAAFWHLACLDRQFRRRRTYQLHVQISAPDPKAPRVLLHARLRGGGTELP